MAPVSRVDAAQCIIPAGTRILGVPARSASSSSEDVQVVFNLQTKERQRRRAAVENADGEYDYVHDEVASRLVDRLLDITREFPHAVDLGAGNGSVLRQLAMNSGLGGIKRLTVVDPCEELLRRDEKRWPELAAAAKLESVTPVVARLEGAALPFESGSVDLVLSSMALHWVNDLPGLLAEVRRILKPDGVFLAAMLGGDSLQELRTAFVAAEQERAGGVSPHVSPLAMVSDAGNLLSSAGFGLPTVDTDTFTIGYPHPAALFHHMRAMGESNAALGLREGAHGDTLLAAAAAYVGMYGQTKRGFVVDAQPGGGSLAGSSAGAAPGGEPGSDARSGDEDEEEGEELEWGEVPATYQVIYLIGWAPAPTQPRPKARGSVPKGFGMRATAAPPGAAGAAAGAAAGTKSPADSSGGACCGSRGTDGCG